MYAIEMQGITKTFHGSYANKEVSLKVEQGEIHSLLGENGAGKTTLMKILFGLYKADKGRILINGSPAAIRSPHDAIDYGISMVHQHFVLVGNLTITENIILGHEPRKGILLDRGKARQKVDALIRRYHFDLNPESRIENLSVGEKQRVEILKALYNESSIILLDEPTAVLTPQEVQELFAMLRQLKKDGRTIIIITHKLKETLAIADNITILRRGENIASLPAAQATEDKLAELMVGRPISFDVQRVPYDGSGPVKLGLKNICLKKKGRSVLTDISLECRAGEILGIAGVEGNGQTELIEESFYRPGLLRIPAGFRHLSPQDAGLCGPHSGGARQTRLCKGIFQLGKPHSGIPLPARIRETRLSEHQAHQTGCQGHHKTV